MAVKIASCEDNINIRETISEYFSKIREEERIDIDVNYFVSAEQLLDENKRDYDIYILDIELGPSKLNGMKLAYSIREVDKEALIIFLTSKLQYVREAYKVRAYRFLTKPISYKEFKLEICSAINDMEIRERRFIVLPNNQIYNKIRVDSIYYVETKGRKTLVHTKQGNIECSYNITKLTEMLEGEDFYRCYNSFLVNIRYIENFYGSIVRIKGEEIPVSRSKIKELKEKVLHRTTKYF